MAISYTDLRNYLEEKLLILGGGKKSEQAVILAGGAGSGKSYATRHFIQGENYKIINPDDIKEMLVKLAKNGNMIGLSTRMQLLLPQIRNLKLSNSEDTAKLHQLVKDFGLDDKQLFYILGNPGGTRTHMPNLMFDCTLKSEKAANEIVSLLLNAGYKPDNIHIVWILTNYKVALQQNYHRDRRVFNDILFDTHLGAKKTMTELVIANYGKMGINGDLAVIIGGPEQKYEILGREVKGGSDMVRSGKAPEQSKYSPAFTGTAGSKEWAKDFTYFRLKTAGKTGIDQDAVTRVLNFVQLLAPPQQGFDSTISKQFPQTQR
jgi:hypothetical protein